MNLTKYKIKHFPIIKIHTGYESIPISWTGVHYVVSDDLTNNQITSSTDIDTLQNLIKKSIDDEIMKILTSL